MQVLERPTTERPSPAVERRTAPAGRVLVSMLVCLGLWALLAAPVLERNASAAPVGARRAAALAVLRPLAAVADALLVSRVTATFERALGKDPAEPPGGELELPPSALPPQGPEPGPPPPSPANTGSPPPVTTTPSETPAAGPSPSPEPAADAGPGVAALRAPEPGGKLRVAVVGDSLSQGLGPAIAHWFDPDLVRVVSLGRQSTGLARQDYFNWTAAMRRIVQELRPDLVFVMLGSNDDQAQVAPDGSAIPVGSAAWVASYRERAARFLREATRAGTRVVWVGIPVVQDQQRWSFYRRVNAIYEETTAADALATFVDAWRLFEAREGGYTAYLRNERGILQVMRAGDGIHFTPEGYGYLARMAIRAAVDAFGLAPKAVTFRV